MIIQEATKNDKAELVSFHRAARVVSDYLILKEYTLAAVRGGYYEVLWNTQFDGSNPQSLNTVYVARDKSEIVGFIRSGLIDAPANLNENKKSQEKWGEIHQLYTAPALKNKGIGTNLLVAGLNNLKFVGAEKVLVNVLSGNVPAQNFYARKGFHPIVDITEYNERDGQIYRVPCTLMGLKLC